MYAMCASQITQQGEQEPTPADTALMERLKQGDMLALEVIFMRYSTMVKAAIYRVAPNVIAADVDELVQDVFIALMDNAPRFDNTKRLKPWLYGIAVNKAAGNKRTGWLHRNILKNHHNNTAVLHVNAANGHDERYATQELLGQAFAKLPKEQHDVMILHAIEGFKGHEIAEILDIETNTVWTRLHRARKTLTANLSPQTDKAGIE